MLELMILGLLAFRATAASDFAEKLAALQAQLAAQPTNTDILFKLGDLCHDEGADDHHKAVMLADKYFRKLLALDSKHAMGRALLGSTLTMEARDAFWPLKRLDLVHQGIREMDAAVALAPVDPRVRFVRANNNFYMPKFLDREAVVDGDFAWLWQQVRTKPDSVPTDIKQETALHYGLILKRRKQVAEAIKIWQQGIQFDPNSDSAAEIRATLAKTKTPKSDK